MSGHVDGSSGSSRQYYPYGSLPELEQPTRTSRPTGSSSLRTHVAPASRSPLAPHVQPRTQATSGPSSRSVAHYMSLGSQAAQQSHQRQRNRADPRAQQPQPLSSARSRAPHGQHASGQALSTYQQQLEELQQSTWAWANRQAVRRQWRDERQEHRTSEHERSATPERQATPQRHWREDLDWDRYFDLEGNVDR
jgi:hypothetical protein